MRLSQIKVGNPGSRDHRLRCQAVVGEIEDGMPLDGLNHAFSLRRDGPKQGLVTLCIAGGEGIALLLETL